MLLFTIPVIFVQIFVIFAKILKLLTLVLLVLFLNIEEGCLVVPFNLKKIETFVIKIGAKFAF